LVIIHTHVLILSCCKACWYPISNIHLCLITGIQFFNHYYKFLWNSNFYDNRLQQFSWYQVICLFQADKTKWVHAIMSLCCVSCWRQNTLSKQDFPVVNPVHSSDMFVFIILCFTFHYFTKYSFYIIYNAYPSVIVTLLLISLFIYTAYLLQLIFC
jgi:hypothetical protein